MRVTSVVRFIGYQLTKVDSQLVPVSTTVASKSSPTLDLELRGCKM